MISLRVASRRSATLSRLGTTNIIRRMHLEPVVVNRSHRHRSGPKALIAQHLIELPQHGNAGLPVRPSGALVGVVFREVAILQE